MERMEHKREYRVPLPARAPEILVEGGENSIGSEWYSHLQADGLPRPHQRDYPLN